jgi:PelA/Pel-15E family pectate lyase
MKVYLRLFKLNTINKLLFLIVLCLLIKTTTAQSNNNRIKENIFSAMLKATKFFDEKVSNNGAYVWAYLPDLSRRWGEMEAYPSMGWIQGSGIVGMGNTFLDAYQITKDEYYYKLAQKSADLLVKGQMDCGGWNYMIDQAGDESLKKWYNTIGKNGWRLEEFQHYYGNATFDDESTTGAAEFLLRFYLIKQDKNYLHALNTAIDLILRSQYSAGGWPQRYPVKGEFSKNGLPDYTPFYTFNDQVIWTNLKFLVMCYQVFEDQRYLDPIKRAMNFFVISQQKPPQAGWAMQYSLDLQPAGARSYEPKALDPQFTAQHVEILIKFFEITGNRKYLETIPDALKWIESVKISSSNNDSIYVVPKFVELRTNKGLFIHRKGTNVNCGKYFFDYENKDVVKHYNSIRIINLKQVKNEFEKAKLMKFDSVAKNSPLDLNYYSGDPLLTRFSKVVEYFELERDRGKDQRFNENESSVEKIIASLDSEGRWLIKHAITSNPYIGEGSCNEPECNKYVSTLVGDKYDTSPFRDPSDQEYISTDLYRRNMEILIDYLKNSNLN